MKRFLFLLLTAVVLFSAPVAGVFAKEIEQSKCPIMGAQPNPKFYADYEGKRVYFCCPPCIGEFEKDPEKYLKMMEDAGIKVEDIPKQ